MEKAGMRFVGQSERIDPKSGRATAVLEYAVAVDEGGSTRHH